MTLCRVCCIEYTWLFVNAQCYVVLCISYSKWIFFFWYSHNLKARNQHNFWIGFFTWNLSITSSHCCIIIHSIQRYNNLCELTHYFRFCLRICCDIIYQFVYTGVLITRTFLKRRLQIKFNFIRIVLPYALPLCSVSYTRSTIQVLLFLF